MNNILSILEFLNKTISTFNFNFLMKKFSFLSLIMTLFVINTFAQSPDTIFNKYYQSTGGLPLWKKVKTYTLKQSFVANAATDYDMEVKASITDKAMLKTKTIMKRSFIYGVGKTDAFLKIPTGSRDKAIVYDVKDLSAKEQNNMKREVEDFLVPFFNYTEKGYIASYVGLETLNTKKVHHVELKGKDIKYDIYFDSTSNLMASLKYKLATGEEITQEFTTYATSELGIKYPSVGTYFSSIDKKKVKLTSQIIFNPTFEATTFKR